MTRKTSLLRWLIGTTAAPPEPPAVDDRPVAKGMKIHPNAEWEAMRGNAPEFDPEQLFKRPEPPAGVLPAGMAMDNLPALATLATWGLQALFHEGLAFPGYAYLAELAQRPEYRHMAEIWAEHATRKWIKLTGPDEKRLGAIEAMLDDLDVRAVFRAADEIDGLFGRAHIYLDFGDGERSQALMVDPRKVTPDRPLRALRAVEPTWLYPGHYESLDPLHADFYRPRYWYVQGRTVADSRLLTFVRHPVPDILKPSYAFGGQSYTQLGKPYVDNWLRTRQSVSDVTSAFSQPILYTDMASTLSGGDGADLFARVDMMNRTRDNRGMVVANKDSELIANVTTPLSSLDKLQAQSQEQLSSVARIPLSIYLQVTPTGLNASSEGEIRSFYADVTAHQEKDYRPNLKRVIELVQLSIDGRIDPDVKFTFEPLWEMSAVEVATVRKIEAETDAVYVTIGAVGNDEVRERLREEDGGLYQSVGLEGDAPPPPEQEDESGPTTAQDGWNESVHPRDPTTAQDGWNESDHPREPDGRFGEGGHAAIAALREQAGERQISRSAIVKALAKEGHEVKSNDPFVVATVEQHNANALSPEAYEKREKERARQARLDALTPEERAEQEARREATRIDRADEYARQVQREKAANVRAVERAASASNAPILEDVPEAEQIRSDLKDVRDGDGWERVSDRVQLAIVKELATRLQAAGWTTRHVSKEGAQETSRYLVPPGGGRQLRLSNHTVPQTAQREAAGGSGGQWDEVIVDSDWPSRLMADYMAEIDEAARRD